MSSFVRIKPFKFGVPCFLSDVPAIAIAPIFLLDVAFPVFAEARAAAWVLNTVGTGSPLLCVFGLLATGLPTRRISGLSHPAELAVRDFVPMDKSA